MEMGVKFRFPHDFEKKAVTDSNTERGQWLGALASTPKTPNTLQNMCRRVILKQLPQNQLISQSLANMQLVKKVVLPQPIVDFLSYKREGYLIGQYNRSSKTNPIPGWYGSDGSNKNFFDATVEYL